MNKIKWYYLIYDKMVMDESIGVAFLNAGFIEGVELENGIQVCHKSGWYLLPFNYFDLKKTKNLKEKI